ncbi:hypothetical protein LL967_08085 [Xanthomonas campestris pv. zinniae]|nr:hypothetical protein [Xanthomonas campestris pv. zinniae]
MANSTAVALLYSEFCKLAYTETHLGISPRAPFDSSDTEELLKQATRVADSAKGLRNKKPGALDDGKVGICLAAVREAQSYFDYINNTNGKPPAKKVFFTAVKQAVNHVDSL